MPFGEALATDCQTFAIERHLRFMDGVISEPERTIFGVAVVAEKPTRAAAG
jgi:hypothetical protein